MTPRLRSSMSQPELWFGVVIGGVFGKSLDTIPDMWWWSAVIQIAILLLTLMAKDRVTDQMKARRDRERAEWLGSGRSGWIRGKWYTADFVVGTAIMLPGVVVSIVALRLIS